MKFRTWKCRNGHVFVAGPDTRKCSCGAPVRRRWRKARIGQVIRRKSR